MIGPPLPPSMKALPVTEEEMIGPPIPSEKKKQDDNDSDEDDDGDETDEVLELYLYVPSFNPFDSTDQKKGSCKQCKFR